MHKGDYHTDYSKYYDRTYKDKDLAYEHIKELKQNRRNQKESEGIAKCEDNLTVVKKRKAIRRKTEEGK